MGAVGSLRPAEPLILRVTGTVEYTMHGHSQIFSFIYFLRLDPARKCTLKMILGRSPRANIISCIRNALINFLRYTVVQYMYLHNISEFGRP